MTFLRPWRQGQGWSQAKAAEELGIPRNVYAQLEVGGTSLENKPHVDALKWLWEQMKKDNAGSVDNVPYS